MRPSANRTLGNVLIIAAAVMLLVFINAMARRSRTAPEALSAGQQGTAIRHVDTQEDVYPLLRGMGVRGMRLVHLNRRFNLLEYALPPETTRSRPFPIEPFDIRQVMEAGLNSDNWLFIATRTGMIRQVTWVLPDPVYENVAPLFARDVRYSLEDGLVRGYSYDLYRVVSRLERLPRNAEPLIVTVDAAFFGPGVLPNKVLDVLQDRLPHIAILVAVDSADEPDVTEEMRQALREFLEDFRLNSGAGEVGQVGSEVRDETEEFARLRTNF